MPSSLPQHSYLFFAGRIADLWVRLREPLSERSPESVPLLDRIFPHYPALLAWIARRGTSVVHGDLDAGNVVGRGEDRLGIIDFGTATLGTPAIDVARMASACAAIAGDPDGHRTVARAWHHGPRRSGRRSRPGTSTGGLALNAQYLMLQYFTPWEDDTRRNAAIASARAIEAALRCCDVDEFVRMLA